MPFRHETREGGLTVIHVGKSLNYENADAFKAMCDDCLKAGSHVFILCFRDTGVLDSTGLGAIFYLYRSVSPKGGKVVFAEISPPVQIVLQLTKTYKIFPHHASLDEAVSAFDRQGT